MTNRTTKPVDWIKAKWRSCVPSLLILVFCSYGMASAHQIRYVGQFGSTLITLNVPDGWSVTFDKEKLFFVSPTGDQRIIAWEITSSKNVQEAELYLRTLMDTIFLSSSDSLSKPGDIHGLPCRMLTAKGIPSLSATETEQDMWLAALVVEAKPGRFFVVINLTDVGNIRDELGEPGDFLKSLFTSPAQGEP